MGNTHQFAVEKMCKVLKVSRSGYYKWFRGKDNREERKVDLESLIRYEFERSKSTYGSPRIVDELNKENYVCSKSTVARYMQHMNIAARPRKKYRITTDSNHDFRLFDNLLNREFEVGKPATAWVSDITYIRMSNKWLYLTVVIDLADRMVIGWTLSRDMTAENTVIRAFNNACKIRKPERGFIFHSDRGVQYACGAFTQLIKHHKGIQSMSRKGNCWDNAVAESFFKTLKIESIYKHRIMSQRQAFSIIFEYIDGWYNTIRRHSALNGLAPIDAFILKTNCYNLAA